MAGKARIKVYAALGEAGGRVFEVDVARPVPLRTMLERLAKQAGFHSQLFEGTGTIRRGYTVLVNGLSIAHREGLDTAVQEGDEVVLLSFVTGGQGGGRACTSSS